MEVSALHAPAALGDVRAGQSDPPAGAPSPRYSLLLSRSKQNTKGYCVFYMSNALTCSGKVHVKRMGSDSTRFMAMAVEIMLFFPPKAL